MLPSLPATLPLICPACRSRDESGWHVNTLELSATLVTAPTTGEVEQGLLTCSYAGCRRSYPILDGIPVVVADLALLLRSELPAALEAVDIDAGLHPLLLAHLAQAGSDTDMLPSLLEHLSIYLDAHWGDQAQPPLDGPGAGGMAALQQRLAARSGAPVRRAVELGCSVGRGLRELAGGAELVVGVDLRLGALRRARRVLAGQPMPYLRRVIGRHYQPAQIHAAAVSSSPAPVLVCADALDPPLLPGHFDRVVALNLLDSVPSPPRLLSVMDALCRPGGEVLLASPYAWQSAVVADAERLGEADPAATLRALLQAGTALSAPYQLEEDRELSWVLRRDARAAQLYQVHYLRARKLSI